MAVSAIVLAAGGGTRMRSTRPKPLHLICGRPMVMHVIHSLEHVKPDRTVVVVGHGGDRVSAKVSEQTPDWAHVTFVEQAQQNGTGHAALIGLTAIPGDELDDTSTVIVMPGDTPLLQTETIEALVNAHESSGNAATVLTAQVDQPTGYGRIVRGRDGRVMRIVEQRDATTDELNIHEVNTGIFAFRRNLLAPALRSVSNNNSQDEYYLTDTIQILAEMGHRIGSVSADSAETAGVNDRWQLALAERELRARTNKYWLLNGVTMFDPRQTFIDVTVEIGQDVTLLPGTILQGRTRIGDGCEVGPNTRLVDTVVEPGAKIQYSVCDGVTVAAESVVGPFVHLHAANLHS